MSSSKLPNNLLEKMVKKKIMGEFFKQKRNFVENQSLFTNSEDVGSDHASWYRVGYPAVCPGEATLNPYIHTSNDVCQHVDMNMVVGYLQFGIGFMTELCLAPSV